MRANFPAINEAGFLVVRHVESLGSCQSSDFKQQRTDSNTWIQRTSSKVAPSCSLSTYYHALCLVGEKVGKTFNIKFKVKRKEVNRSRKKMISSSRLRRGENFREKQ